MNTSTDTIVLLTTLDIAFAITIWAILRIRREEWKRRQGWRNG